MNEQDGASLIKAVVSKEAKLFRQQLCEIIADILCQRIITLFGQGIAVTRFSRVVRETGLSAQSSLSAYDYNSIFRDRRLRVIFSKALKSARRDPILMLRFCWASFLIILTSSVLACHRILVSLSKVYLRPLVDAPKRYAVGA